MSNGRKSGIAAAGRLGSLLSGRRRLIAKSLPVIGLASVMALVVWLKFSAQDAKESSLPLTGQAGRAAEARTQRRARTFSRLLTNGPRELEEIDVAEMNLLCAEGLPGSEGLDVRRCLAVLDNWTWRIKSETVRHLYRFRQNPAAYGNSEGYFRMLTVVTVLQQDFGVRYNKHRIRDIDFTNSRDLFIHGMIDDENGGTCVSMPVLYTAVARRLGYPVKLVLAKSHLFCRWDAPGERFNVEATNKGMNSFGDDYYKTWPEKMTPGEFASGRYLRSLTPAEELACFLALRGHCLVDTARPREALAAYGAACRFAPKDPAYRSWARQAQARLMPPVAGRTAPRGLRRPPMVYRTPPMRDVESINAYNRRLIEQHPQPLTPPAPHGPTEPASPGQRPGMPQPHPPGLPAQPPR